MELSPLLIGGIIITVLLAIAVVYYGWKIKLKRESAGKAKVISYTEARELARAMLQGRYQGQRGFIKPYAKEFNFSHSPETLRKVLQNTNPVPNRHYLQTVLNDLAPGQYEVLPPYPKNDSQAVA